MLEFESYRVNLMRVNKAALQLGRGDRETRRRGESENRRNGDGGDTEKRRHGETETRRHGDAGKGRRRRRGDAETRRRGQRAMVLCFNSTPDSDSFAASPRLRVSVSPTSPSPRLRVAPSC